MKASDLLVKCLEEEGMEVILGVSFKSLSNYVNHVAETPLDDAFATQAWIPVADRLAT